MIIKFRKWLDKMICKYKGHDFETYWFQSGHQFSNDIEQAGLCLRCGFDTSMERHEKEVTE